MLIQCRTRVDSCEWTRQTHEGEHSNWLYKIMLWLSHLFQVELSLFSKTAFSKTTYSFLYKLTFSKTYPSSVSTYNEIKESTNSGGNNFIVLFKIGLSCFMNKFSFRSNLNLVESVTKMLKSSKFMAQLHCNRWSDIADGLMLFRLLL